MRTIFDLTSKASEGVNVQEGKRGGYYYKTEPALQSGDIQTLERYTDKHYVWKFKLSKDEASNINLEVKEYAKKNKCDRSEAQSRIYLFHHPEEKELGNFEIDNSKKSVLEHFYNWLNTRRPEDIKSVASQIEHIADWDGISMDNAKIEFYRQISKTLMQKLDYSIKHLDS